MISVLENLFSLSLSRIAAVVTFKLPLTTLKMLFRMIGRSSPLRHSKRTGQKPLDTSFQVDRLQTHGGSFVDGQLERCARKSSSYLAGLGVIAAAFERGPAPTSLSGAYFSIRRRSRGLGRAAMSLNGKG